MNVHDANGDLQNPLVLVRNDECTTSSSGVSQADGSETPDDFVDLHHFEHMLQDEALALVEEAQISSQDQQGSLYALLNHMPALRELRVGGRVLPSLRELGTSLTNLQV